MEREHGHYFRDVTFLQEVDIYRVLELFGITDQKLGHAIKKLMVAGGRGHKDIDKDIKEAIDTLQRWQEMRREDKRVAAQQAAIRPLATGAWAGADGAQTQDKPEAGVWFDWHGGSRPEDPETMVRVQLASGCSETLPAGTVRWDHKNSPPAGGDIVKYMLV